MGHISFSVVTLAYISLAYKPLLANDNRIMHTQLGGFNSQKRQQAHHVDGAGIIKPSTLKTRARKSTG